jgi:PAS domain S-box-containing protein
MPDAIEQPRDSAPIEAIIDRNPPIVAVDSSVLQAIELMPTEGANSCYALVLEVDRVVGILTATDIVRSIATNQDLAAVRVGMVMSAPVITLTLSPDLTVVKALALLATERLDRVPIVDVGGKLVGIVTATSLLTSYDPVAVSAEVENLRERNFTEAKRDKGVRKQAELALQESEEQFRILATHAPVGIFQADARGRCVFVNHKCLELTGLSFAQALDRGWQGAIHPEDRALVFQAWAETVRTRGEFALEFRLQTPQGRVNWVAGNAVVVQGELGATTGFFGTLTDINQLKQLELDMSIDRQQLAAFFSQSLDGFFFMMLDRPIVWNETIDREAALDYAFEHQQITRVNGAMLAQYGATEAEFIGYTPRDFFPRDLETGRQIWTKLFDRGRLHIETYEYKLDGTPMWIEGDYICLYDPHDRIVGHFGVQRDITARKQEQEDLSRISSALSNAVEGISQLDAQGRYLMVNHAYAKMVGYHPDFLVGQEWQITVHPDDLPQVMAAYAVMLETGKVEVAARGIRQDGSIFYKQLMMIADYDLQGQLTGHYCFMKDISDRQLAEAEIARQQQELQRSNLELQQFAYVASHDLQEPLRMITSYLELLEHRYKGQLDDRADKFIAYAVDGAARMQTLIQDLLSYSRVGTQSKPFTAVDCESIVKDTLANLQVAIAESNATITIDPLPQVTGDAIQLTQVFQNLIGNAIKFRRADNPPQIHIGVCKDRDDWLFSIRDNGIGIDGKYIDRIFVIFQRLHSRTDYSGTGIGLAVCKKIVERHGGKIWVESALNCGSTFYFTIPDRSGGD